MREQTANSVRQPAASLSPDARRPGNPVRRAQGWWSQERIPVPALVQQADFFGTSMRHSRKTTTCSPAFFVPPGPDLPASGRPRHRGQRLVVVGGLRANSQSTASVARAHSARRVVPAGDSSIRFCNSLILVSLTSSGTWAGGVSAVAFAGTEDFFPPVSHMMRPSETRVQPEARTERSWAEDPAASVLFPVSVGSGPWVFLSSQLFCGQRQLFLANGE